MNKKLSDWASIAEIASGVAVIITLIVLIVGVRENTSVTRAAVYGNLVDGISALDNNRMNDQELMVLWQAFRSGEAFDMDDPAQRRLGVYLGLLARNYEKAYYNFRYGVIGQSEWERFREPMCGVYGSAREQGFDRLFNTGGLSPDFREFVVQECGD